MAGLEPTRSEARRIVAFVIGFWALGGSSGFLFDPESPVALVLVLPALACGFAFYWAVFSVAGREAGRSAWWYFNSFPGRDLRLRSREVRAVLLRIINPRWWHRVAQATGWPAGMVDVALVAALAYAVATLVVTPEWR